MLLNSYNAAKSSPISAHSQILHRKIHSGYLLLHLNLHQKWASHRSCDLRDMVNHQYGAHSLIIWSHYDRSNYRTLRGVDPQKKVRGQS
jgi:hypothetical protein